jgi:hypothetical protein
MHLKGRDLLKAYKAYNPSIPWQCGTLNNLVAIKFIVEKKGDRKLLN